MHNRLWLKGGVIALGCLYCRFFIIAGCIVLLKETADMKECPCDEGVCLVCNNAFRWVVLFKVTST